MTRLLAAGAILLALSVPGAAAEPTEAYDLLFKNGTLDPIERGAVLVYGRTVENALSDDASDRDTGTIVLKVEDGEEGPDVADLQFRQGDGKRALGSFPASVGNPMIMYFYESTVRDMAETAGGSPFYIRNRVKDALTVTQEIETGTATLEGEEIEVSRVTLRPFEDDPNRDAMRGFEDLEMTVTMSGDVPGWYLSLVAEVPGQDGPIYVSRVEFQGMEAAQ